MKYAATCIRRLRSSMDIFSSGEFIPEDPQKNQMEPILQPDYL